MGYRQSGIVAAGQHQAVQQFLQQQRVPRLEIHGGPLRHITGSDGIGAALIGMFQSHHGGHNLGNAGDQALLVRILLVEYPAAVLLNQHR